MNLCHTIVLNFVKKWNSEFKTPRWNNLSPYPRHTELKISGKYAERIEWNIWQRCALSIFQWHLQRVVCVNHETTKKIDHEIIFQTHTNIGLLDFPTKSVFVCTDKSVQWIHPSCPLESGFWIYFFFGGNFSCNMNNYIRQVTFNFMKFSNICLYWRWFSILFHTARKYESHLAYHST